MEVGSILSQIIVAVMTGLITAYFTYRKAREDAEIRLLSMIDEGTAKERLEAYKTLWKKMKLLPQYPPTPNVTYEAVKTLNEEFRDWYFCEGGIYLTAESKDLYMEAQKVLYDLWKEHRESLAVQIKGEEYDAAREKLSDLRDQLAEDLRSRLPPGASGETAVAKAGEDNRWSSPA